MLSEKLSIPIIGIGSGVDCDGQILVYHDLLGLSNGRCGSFVKQFTNVYNESLKGLNSYKNEVKEGKYPDDKYSPYKVYKFYIIR